MRWQDFASLRKPGTGAGNPRRQGIKVDALLVVGSVALSVIAGLVISRGLISLMLSALPSIHSIPTIRSGPAPDAP